MNNRCPSFRDSDEGAPLSAEAWSPWRVNERREIGALTTGDNTAGEGPLAGMEDFSRTGNLNR